MEQILRKNDDWELEARRVQCECSHGESENPRGEPESPRGELESPRVEPESPRVEPESPRVEPESPRVEPENSRGEPESPCFELENSYGWLENPCADIESPHVDREGLPADPAGSSAPCTDTFSPAPAVAGRGATPAEYEGKAAFFRGEELFFGKNGVERDAAAAVRCYKAAAQDGVVQGLYALALCLLSGDGTAPDPQEGVRLLKVAARELPDACYLLGICHLEGKGVRKNTLMGVFWLQEAVKLAREGQSEHPLSLRLLERLSLS